MRNITNETRILSKNTKAVIAFPNGDLTIGDVRSAYHNKEIINLIKYWRAVTGDGLKNSKDAIERIVRNPDGTWNDNCEEKLLTEFLGESYRPELTKEEFINMVSDAIDKMQSFQCTDMIEAVEFLFKGIKAKGGLTKIAQENDDFLDQI